MLKRSAWILVPLLWAGISPAIAHAQDQDPGTSKEASVALSAPSSPPLTVDDVGIPAPGEFEVNFITEGDQKALAFSIDANFGAKLPALGEVQLTVGLSRSWLREQGISDFEGTQFRIKKILTDQGRVTIALFPALGLPATQAARDEGIGERVVVKIPLLFSERIAHRWSMVENVGYEYHQDGPDLAAISAGLSYTLRDGFALMGDTYLSTSTTSSTPLSGSVTGVEFGFTHALVKDSLNIQGSVGYEWSPDGPTRKANLTLQWYGRYRKKSKAELAQEARRAETEAREEIAGHPHPPHDTLFRADFQHLVRDALLRFRAEAATTDR